MALIQRIDYLTKEGERYSLILEIVAKKNKRFTVRHPGEKNTFDILCRDIERISEPVVEKDK